MLGDEPLWLMRWSAAAGRGRRLEEPEAERLATLVAREHPYIVHDLLHELAPESYYFAGDMDGHRLGRELARRRKLRQSRRRVSRGSKCGRWTRSASR